MPRLPIDYSRTQMYKIVCKDLTITYIYVGHTTRWKDRKRKHKKYCGEKKDDRKDYDFPVYQFIRNNGGWDNWSMILIEEYSCENKLQATQRERYWIETLNATLNCNIPSRTKQEYYIDNKQKIIEYNDENREHINELKKIKYECECGCIINRNNKWRHFETKKHQDYMERKES
jgi:hypothetical protein